MDINFIWNKNINLVLTFFLVVYSVFGQEQKTRESHRDVASSICVEDLRAYLNVLASDSLEGRETGRPGQKKAGRFIKDKFGEFGLKKVDTGHGKSYFQSFDLAGEEYGEIFLEVDGRQFHQYDQLIYAGTIQGVVEDTVEIVFAGLGEGKEFRNIDVNARAVAFFNNKGMDWQTKVSRAVDHGYQYVFVIYTDPVSSFRTLTGAYQNYFDQPVQHSAGGEDGLQHIFLIHSDLAEIIFDRDLASMEKAVERYKRGRQGALEKIRSSPVRFYGERKRAMNTTENVLGYIEGKDKPHEVVVVTAHYDHLGVRDGQIYFGADDNGSGTAAVLELAEAFAILSEIGEGPGRSVLFIAFTGEEIGLVGSDYYIKNAVFPLKNTVAAFNIDMIGRRDNKHPGDSGYVYIIGSDKLSMDLHQISESVNQRYAGLKLDYTYNDENDPNRFYYRSDQYNFARNDIPVIFYFTGVHEDYHRPTDTVDKIDFKQMEDITRLIFHTVWEVADRENRIGLK